MKFKVGDVLEAKASETVWRGTYVVEQVQGIGSIQSFPFYRIRSHQGGLDAVYEPSVSHVESHFDLIDGLDRILEKL